MSDPTKTAIDKLKIIPEITQNQELKQTIKVIIELAAALDEGTELGFTSSKETI